HVELSQLGITKKRFPMGKLDQDFFHSSPQSRSATRPDPMLGAGNPDRSKRDLMESKGGRRSKYAVSSLSPLSHTPPAPSSVSSPITASLRVSGTSRVIS